MSARRRGELRGIIPERRRRARTAEQRLVFLKLRRVELCAKADQFSRDPGKRLLRHRQLKAHVRLKQHAFRLHQAVSDRAIGRLAEIAALGMLEVRAARNELDEDIRHRVAG